MCGRVPGGPWSARWTQIRLLYGWLGPGNTNIPLSGLYRLGTTLPTHPGYTPPPYPPGPHPVPHPSMSLPAVTRTPGTCTYDQFRVGQGDPRGVKRIGSARGAALRECCAATGVTLRTPCRYPLRSMPQSPVFSIQYPVSSIQYSVPGSSTQFQDPVLSSRSPLQEPVAGARCRSPLQGPAAVQ